VRVGSRHSFGVLGRKTPGKGQGSRNRPRKKLQGEGYGGTEKNKPRGKNRVGKKGVRNE